MKDNDFEIEWKNTVAKLSSLFNKEPNLDSILFLIGVQELGKGALRFSKEEKQDLMHIAVCRLMSNTGYYVLNGHDKDGWPLWENVKKLPSLSLKEQEAFLKVQIIEYFSDI